MVGAAWSRRPCNRRVAILNDGRVDGNGHRAGVDPTTAIVGRGSDPIGADIIKAECRGASGVGGVVDRATLERLTGGKSACKIPVPGGPLDIEMMAGEIPVGVGGPTTNCQS